MRGREQGPEKVETRDCRGTDYRTWWYRESCEAASREEPLGESRAAVACPWAVL